jgi:hypothetical protein
MRRLGTIVMAVALVAAVVAVPLGVAASVSDHDRQNEPETEPTAPGEQLAGIVGVQSAAVDGELSERTYGVKIANAQTNESKADVVTERLTEIEQRLTDHETRLDELNAEREAGNISEGTYRAKVATVSAEKANTERAAERAGETARQLPETVLAERGINVTAIEALRTNARDLGGPETAEIARSIGGERANATRTGNRPAAAERKSPAGNETRGENRAPAGSDRDTGTDSADRGVGNNGQTPKDDKTESSDDTASDNRQGNSWSFQF